MPSNCNRLYPKPNINRNNSQNSLRLYIQTAQRFGVIFPVDIIVMSNNKFTTPVDLSLYCFDQTGKYFVVHRKISHLLSTSKILSSSLKAQLHPLTSLLVLLIFSWIVGEPIAPGYTICASPCQTKLMLLQHCHQNAPKTWAYWVQHCQ